MDIALGCYLYNACTEADLTVMMSGADGMDMCDVSQSCAEAAGAIALMQGDITEEDYAAVAETCTDAWAAFEAEAEAEAAASATGSATTKEEDVSPAAKLAGSLVG